MTGTATYWIGFGDLHDDIGNVARIPGLAGAAGVIVSGDLTTRGGAPQAARVVEAVRAINPAVHAQVGNMDGPAVDQYLRQQDVNLHLQVVELCPGVAMMGVGCSTPTPFGTPGEVPDEQLAAWLDQVHAQAVDYGTLLLVAHDPPFGTAADEVRPGVHVGSRAVREFVLRVRPEVCLTGHIHESRGVEDLGPTRVINPGPLFRGGYAVIRLEGGRLRAELEQI